jgi:CRISPR-associated protein Csb1
MPAFVDKLKKVPRLLMEANLRPIQSERFQATGFPHLGPARYELHDGTPMLLVESAQSVANRLESACMNDAQTDLIAELQGLPYVKIDLGENAKWGTTSTLVEFHRMNSPYIWDGETDDQGGKFRKDFCEMIWGKDLSETNGNAGMLDLSKLALALAKFDPNSIIHGVFLENVDGRLRITRALSGFIEARNIREVESGGVKFDRVFPKKIKLDGVSLASGRGFTHVPFHRTEFTAEKITAYFNLDLALLRGYGLDDDVTELLVALSLFKVQRFLAEGFRLRTACDLEPVEGIIVTRPDDLTVPDQAELTEIVKNKIGSCGKKGILANPPVTKVLWKPSKKTKGGKETASDETTDVDDSGVMDE